MPSAVTCHRIQHPQSSLDVKLISWYVAVFTLIYTKVANHGLVLSQEFRKRSVPSQSIEERDKHFVWSEGSTLKCRPARNLHFRRLTRRLLQAAYRRAREE